MIIQLPRRCFSEIRQRKKLTELRKGADFIPRQQYIHRVSKNVPPLACYNFDAHEWILIFLAEMLLIK